MLIKKWHDFSRGRIERRGAAVHTCGGRPGVPQANDGEALHYRMNVCWRAICHPEVGVFVRMCYRREDRHDVATRLAGVASIAPGPRLAILGNIGKRVCE